MNKTSILLVYLVSIKLSIDFIIKLSFTKAIVDWNFQWETMHFSFPSPISFSMLKIGSKKYVVDIVEGIDISEKSGNLLDCKHSFIKSSKSWISSTLLWFKSTCIL